MIHINWQSTIVRFIILSGMAMLFQTELFAQKLDVSFITPDIARVQWSADGELHDNNTGVCVYTAQKVKVKSVQKGDIMTLSSPTLSVVIDGTLGNIRFIDRKTGKELLADNGHCYEPVVQERIIYDEKSAHTEETANGKVTVRDVVRRDTIGRSIRYEITFGFTPDEALYGLGSHMEDYMNLNSKSMYLTQHNLKATIPVLNSTKGYGLLFDAGCAMKLVNGVLTLEAAKEVDYYFIKGENLDALNAGYRYLTGDAPLMPRYLFGYTQSKERYVSSQDIISTLRHYRELHVPIDMIVQDWNYWPQGWGYMKMNSKFYPSPRALADSVHAMNAKLMVSIWPNPQWCPEAEDFKQRGMMLEHDVYDVFNPEARKHYWSYAEKEFFSQGFDAWWCDSSEPLDGDWNQTPQPLDGKAYSWEDHERRWELNKNILSEATGAERSNLYSLNHSRGIYENQTANNPEGKRVVNLTRSTYAGQQRYGTIVWNGDTHASWMSFRQQIPSGLNYMATGNQMWTVDVGSFFTRDEGRRWFYKGEFPGGVADDNYKEYYVRMFQWATFLPMLRSHGSDTPREIWHFMTDSEKSSGTSLKDCKYAGAILDMINLRYQHIPYIYSMAASQKVFARLLAYDFPEDKNVLDIKDEYMFGNILVCPVTHPMSETLTRKVYLPNGTKWYDYWTDNIYEGGQWIDCKTEALNLPLFVKAGSIIPTTEVAEYSDAQKGIPITVNIYPGADADFTLYEDEGDNYNYMNGKFTTMIIKWNDKKGKLSIGKPQGSYNGMQENRNFITKIHAVK